MEVRRRRGLSDAASWKSEVSLRSIPSRSRFGTEISQNIDIFPLEYYFTVIPTSDMSYCVENRYENRPV